MIYNLNVDGALNRRQLFNEHDVKQKTDQTSAIQTEQNINHEYREDYQSSQFQNISQYRRKTVSSSFIADLGENKEQEDEVNDMSENSKICMVKPSQDIVHIYNQKKNTRERQTLSLKPLTIKRNSRMDNNNSHSQLYSPFKQSFQQHVSQSLDRTFEDINNINSDQNHMIPNYKIEKDKVVVDQQQSKYIKIITFSYVYKFIRESFLKQIQKDASFLTVSQHQIINDKSVYIDKKKKKEKSRTIQTIHFKNIFERLQFLRENKLSISNKQKMGIRTFLFNLISYLTSTIKNIFHAIPIISPNNSGVLLWDILFVTICMLFLLIYPFDISFNQSMLSINTLDFLQKAFLIATTLDCILGFHTGVYEFGKIVINRKRIYQGYINKRLLYDVLCMFLLLMGILSNFQVFSIISVLFRYQSFIEKIERITMNLQLKSLSSSSYELIKLAFYLLFLIHIFGCGFYLVGDVSVKHASEQQNWIIVSKIQNSSTVEQYIFSIYFIMVSMVTIGYGDIYPVNMYEKLYVIVVSFISSILFGYSLNLIGSVITEMKKKSNDLMQKQLQIQKYLNSRNIDLQQQMRVLKYLEFLNSSQDQNIIEGQKILQLCSQEIREDILFEHFGKVLKQCKLFKELFSKEFLRALSLKMHEKSFAPGEVIIERGQRLSQLFIITKGEVDYFFNSQDQQEYLSQYENNVIDARLFCSQQPSDLSLRSRGVTLVSCIDYSTFIEIISVFQIDKEKFSQLKDQFLNDQRYQYPCQSCGLFKHILFDCPLLSYKVNRTKFLNKYAEKVFQKRDESFKRIIKKDPQNKFNTLALNEYIKYHLKIYRCNLAKVHYAQIYPHINFDSIPYENHHDDKEFLQTVPKINCEWYTKQQTGIDTERVYNYQQSDATGNYYKLQQYQNDTIDLTSSSNESDSSQNQSFSKTKSKGTIGLATDQISINNEIPPQISAFMNNDQRNQALTPLNQKGDQEQCRSDIKITSENKISLLSNRMSIPQIPYMEEPLSPQIQMELTSVEPPSSQFNALKESILSNQIDNVKEQMKPVTQMSKLVNRNLNEKQKAPLKRGQGQQQNEIRSQSRNSLSKSQKDIDILKSIVPETDLKRQSVYQQRQSQIQDQVQNILEIIRHSICINNDKPNHNMNGKTTYSATKRNMNTKVYDFQQNGNMHSNRSQSIKKSHTHESTSRQIHLKQCALFGKLGLTFETFKEFSHYYPKYNYSYVIRAFKKLQLLKLRKGRGDTLWGIASPVVQPVLTSSIIFNNNRRSVNKTRFSNVNQIKL